MKSQIKQKQKRKLSYAEACEIHNIIFNSINICIWIADFFLALFKPAAPNVLAALAIAMCILLFIERLYNAILRYKDAKTKAIALDSVARNREL